MTDRPYTVKEIDGMRSAIQEIERRKCPQRWPAIPMEQVEQLLRTYMEGGIDPSDLYDRVEDYAPPNYRRWRQEQQTWEDRVADDWVRPDGKPRNKKDHGPTTAVEYSG